MLENLQDKAAINNNDRWIETRGQFTTHFTTQEKHQLSARRCKSWNKISQSNKRLLREYSPANDALGPNIPINKRSHQMKRLY